MSKSIAAPRSIRESLHILADLALVIQDEAKEYNAYDTVRESLRKIASALTGHDIDMGVCHACGTYVYTSPVTGSVGNALAALVSEYRSRGDKFTVELSKGISETFKEEVFTAIAMENIELKKEIERLKNGNGG